jgi:hypothetical protein
MKVEFVFAADYAVAQEDGRLNTIGAGIRIISVTEFPVVIPNLSIVIGLDFDEDEVGKQFKLESTILGPTGDRVLGPVVWDIDVPHSKELGPPYPFRATVSAQHIELSVPGDYRLMVAVNGRVRKTVMLTAIKSPSGRQR